MMISFSIFCFLDKGTQNGWVRALALFFFLDVSFLKVFILWEADL
jgi:hypothetical protein